ncbi:MAG TPA: hypothetical protein VHN16_11170 [Streptosporangiaceae bacterium]|nr:hypothetical protein [Streptosporangiaceae bacterium]
MEPGAGPRRGVFAVVDVHYLASGGARAAVVVAEDAAFSAVPAAHTVIVLEVTAYRPGKFYLRDLPPLRAVLCGGVAGLGLLIVDGYADLAPSGRPGLGAHAHAHAEFGVPVVGLVKSAFLIWPIPQRRASSGSHRCVLWWWLGSPTWPSSPVGTSSPPQPT